jgi:hypothetical protein
VLSLYRSGAFPEGTRRVGKPAVRWLDSAEEDLKKMGVRNWRRQSQEGTNGEQSYKRSRFFMKCSAHRRRRRRRRRRNSDYKETVRKVVVCTAFCLLFL